MFLFLSYRIMGTRVAAVHFPDKNLAGITQLLEDLQRLAEDHDSADIVFLVGREEMPVYAHRIILMARWVESKILSLLFLIYFIIITATGAYYYCDFFLKL